MSTTTVVTAENVTTLFPEVSTRLIAVSDPPTTTQSNGDASAHDDLAGYDAEQIRLMDELCIVLSPADEAIGTASKKTCHLMSNINAGLLHRAFSAFVFDPRTKKLLLQQRASEKITFPDMWTNTCCSHPLAHPSETGHGDLASNVEGAKRAAVRKLDHELGIPARQLPLADFAFLTRIHYLAASPGAAGKWGEHEIDYILVIEADVQLDINRNEVQDTRWVSQDELKRMFQEANEDGAGETGLKFTPWFRLICESMLFQWWDALEQGQLAKFTGEEQIRRM